MCIDQQPEAAAWKPRTIITSRNEAARPLRHPATEAMNRMIIAGLTIALLASPVPARAFSMVCQEVQLMLLKKQLRIVIRWMK